MNIYLLTYLLIRGGLKLQLSISETIIWKISHLFKTLCQLRFADVE